MLSHPSLHPSYEIGSSGSGAHDWANITIITQDGTRYMKDQWGRSLLMRGCSLSGLSKFPLTPDGLSHHHQDFFEHQSISFVGRPFPLSEAHEHFARLQQWGLTFLRFVVPWESLEHAGPGLYDYEYIDYLEALVDMMPMYGIKAYIDAHQDVWSRHTGGSGAPHWTLEVAGFDLRNLKATGAAHAHNLHLDPSDPPPKVWPSGYCKLAAATMATLFWAGDTFAPKRKVPLAVSEKKEGVQSFLQRHMIEAFGVLADRLRDKEAIMGFEVINEPHRGYIELVSYSGWDFNTDLAIGYFPSAIQSWALGSGHAVVVPHYAPAFPVTAITHETLFAPPLNRRAWRQDVECVWQQHGVWKWNGKKGRFGEPVILKADYFNRHPATGEEVEWYRDFYWPFCQDFGKRIAKANPTWNTFVGPIPNEFCPAWPSELRPHSLVYAPHWYDLQALFSKALGTMTANVQGLSRGMFLLQGLYFGRKGIKKNYSLQIANIVNAGYRSIGEAPVIIGETGVPFDLNGGIAFKTGDFSWQERQMDAICSALEDSLVSYNLWNYNPLNNDEWGDSWNGENFSWYSLSDVTPKALASADAAGGEAARLNVGGRVLNAVERPYAAKIAGIPLSVRYDQDTLAFSFRFANPSTTTAKASSFENPDPRACASKPPLIGPPVLAKETEIFLPRRRYEAPAADGRLRVRINEADGEWKYDAKLQTLYFVHQQLEQGYIHSITITVAGQKRRDYLWVLALLGIVLGVVYLQFEQ